MFITPLELSFSLAGQTQTIYFSHVSACHVVNPAKDTESPSSLQMWNITQIQTNMQIPCVLVRGFYRNLTAKFMLGWTPKNINRLADTSFKSQRANSTGCSPLQQLSQEVQHHVFWETKISSHLACRFAARRRWSQSEWPPYQCWAEHGRWMEESQAQQSPKCTNMTVQMHKPGLAQTQAASWGYLHFACVVAGLLFKVAAKNIAVQARAGGIYILLV